MSGDRGMPGRAPTGAIEELDEDACWRLLRQSDFGRLAFNVGGQAEIFPVNYAITRRLIVMRTGPGTKLEHASYRRVALEIDEVDRRLGEAWSVVAKGLAEDVTGRSDVDSVEAQQTEVATLAPGVHDHVVVIEVAHLSGRRFRIRDGLREPAGRR